MSLHSPIYLFVSVDLLLPPQCCLYTASYKSFRYLADRVGCGMIRFLYFGVCPLPIFWYFIQFQQYLGMFDPVSLSSSLFYQLPQHFPLVLG